jgi:HK97 gp10 family phage protein
VSARIKNSGFRELDRNLAMLARGFSEQKLRAALHAGGEIIAAEARRLVPVDTGTLKDSIQVTDERDARVYGKVNGAGVSVYVGPVGSTEDGDVPYAKFVEFGTARAGAQPFMRPAIASKRPEAERVVAARLAADLAGQIR